MTNEQTTLLKNSFVLIQRNTKELGISFYKNLFDAAPQLRPLFKTDIEIQADKLFQIIGWVINNCDRLNVIKEKVHELGKKHHRYGVHQEYYPLVSDILIKTLENALKEQFTPAVRKAWSDILTEVCGILQTSESVGLTEKET